MSGALAGKVVAIIGPGGDAHRTLAVLCAELGANIALATTNRERDQEFAVNSIANEVWAIGREQFATPINASDDTAVIAFADEVWDRLGRCDVLVAAHDAPASAPLDELSPDEWEITIRENLTAPYLALQAFGRLMEREGGGMLVAVVPPLEGADAAYAAARAGLREFCASVEEAWRSRSVHCVVVDGSAGLEALLTGP